MSKFKVGDKVIPVKIDDICAHGLYEDETYLVDKIRGLGLIDIIGNFRGFSQSPAWGSNWSEDLFKLADEQPSEKEDKEMTAEQIRDEIIRIDLRIEEAKKDIESAEEERNSLVDKLREKGFEMLEQGVPDTRRPEVGDEVVVIGYSKALHDCDYTGLVGTLDHDDRTARPYKVFLDKTGQSHWFAENEIKKI